MKRSRIALIGLVVCLAFTGCESTRQDIATGVREKFSGPTYERRIVEGENGVVFEAARSRASEMGFRITRAGAAQGIVEGVSGITSDDTLRGSRQRTIKVRLSAASGGGVEVAVLFMEIIEDDFNKGAGLGTEAPLRRHPLYASFLDGLEQALAK
ncbi:MAG: hypothetical protein H7Y06_03295 [Opitutaceae bacterium]|nr:hypothetical protein [Opitutaceae bacterium]